VKREAESRTHIPPFRVTDHVSRITEFRLDTDEVFVYRSGDSRLCTPHACLVAHNTREFGRVDGLQVEDWELAGG
jgi:hypothetical protein